MWESISTWGLAAGRSKILIYVGAEFIYLFFFFNLLEILQNNKMLVSFYDSFYCYLYHWKKTVGFIFLKSFIICIHICALFYGVVLSDLVVLILFLVCAKEERMTGNNKNDQAYIVNSKIDLIEWSFQSNLLSYHAIFFSTFLLL